MTEGPLRLIRKVPLSRKLFLKFSDTDIDLVTKSKVEQKQQFEQKYRPPAGQINSDIKIDQFGNRIFSRNRHSISSHAEKSSHAGKSGNNNSNDPKDPDIISDISLLGVTFAAFSLILNFTLLLLFTLSKSTKFSKNALILTNILIIISIFFSYYNNTSTGIDEVLNIFQLSRNRNGSTKSMSDFSKGKLEKAKERLTSYSFKRERRKDTNINSGNASAKNTITCTSYSASKNSLSTSAESKEEEKKWKKEPLISVNSLEESINEIAANTHQQLKLTPSRPAPETPSPKEKERDECDLNLKKSNNTNRAKSPPPLPKTKPGQGTNTNNLGSSKNSQEYLEELELVAEQFEEAAADLILEGDDGLGVLKR